MSSANDTGTTTSGHGNKVIAALAKVLSSTQAASAVKDQLLRLQRHSTSYGFDAAQCQRLLNLALRGTTRRTATLNGKPPKAGAAVAILRCIVPSPGAKLGSEFVYSVLASLGPNPGTKTETDAGLTTISQDDEIDQTSPSQVGPNRVKVDIRVQAAVIRLLCVLLDSPPVPLNLAATLAPVEEGGEPRQPSELGGALPTSYLTLAARATLQRCYGVLFHFLDYQAFRPHLYYLLCKTTKRKHVKHYRIAKLMSLRANFAAEAGLSALLSVYANFYPDLLFPELLGGSGSTSSVGSNGVPGMKFPDNDWLGRALRCHAKHARRAMGERIESDDEEGAQAQADKSRPSKRARVSLDGKATADIEASKLPLAALPNLVTIQPQTSLNKTLGTSPALITELSSLRHLAHSLDRLTLPSQVASMLAPTFGARLMRVAILSGATISNDVSLSQDDADADAVASSDAKASDYCWVRLSDWLESVVRDEIGLGAAPSRERIDAGSGTKDDGAFRAKANRIRLPANQSAHNRLASLLLRAAQTFDTASEIPKRFEETLCQVLRGLTDVATATPPQWTTQWEALCSEIVSFVPLMKPRAWPEFNELVVEPLKQLCQAPSVGEAAAADIVIALAKMLQRWAKRDWAQIGRSLDGSATVQWGISTLDKGVNYFDTISHSASVLDEMANEVLLQHPRSVMVEHATLSCYEVLLGPLCGLHRVCMVPPLAFYAFSCGATSAMPLSRLAGLMQQMRSSHANYVAAPLVRNAGAQERSMRALQARYFAEESTMPLNKAVTVLVDFAWRGRAFEEAMDENAPKLGFDRTVITELTATSQERGLAFHLSSSITHHPSLANLSDRCINEYCQQHSSSGGGNSTSRKTAAAAATWINGPVNPRVMQKAKQQGVPNDWTVQVYRRHLLDWLRDRGMRGLEEFIKNSLRNYGGPPQQPTPAASAAAAETSMDA